MDKSMSVLMHFLYWIYIYIYIYIYISRFNFFFRHIHNYTEYNQQWNVSKVRSMDSAIICNTNTIIYINIGMKKEEENVQDSILKT